jgi:hypothetical protein
MEVLIGYARLSRAVAEFRGSFSGILGVLDPRLYQLELIKGSPESFRAASRKKIVKAAAPAAGNPQDKATVSLSISESPDASNSRRAPGAPSLAARATQLRV